MTYSIVARDPINGDLGVAVQSHYFGTGAIVTWAEAGVGAVATQSIVEVSYGPHGLDRMRGGIAADQCLSRLIASDPMEKLRQVAMIDANGIVGTHTGAGCVGRAGHRQVPQVSAQANLMERDTVWDAMIDAYHAAAGPDLAERLLVALEAAESEGGDVRGQQSAAILVVSGKRSEAPWEQKKVDLRVDDSQYPLIELRRLLGVSRAVSRFTQVIDSGLLFAPTLDATDPRLLSALEELKAVQNELGDNSEPAFWSAVLLAKAGRTAEARKYLALATRTNQRWPLLLRSLADAGVLSAGNALLH